MPGPIAYLPLDSYPEAAPDEAIRAALAFAGALGCKLQTTAFAVRVPPVASPLGGFLINIDGMVRAAEETSRKTCQHLHDLVTGSTDPGAPTDFAVREVDMGRSMEAAAVEARRFDLALVPWSEDGIAAQDMAQALIFGAGHPVILVPRNAPTGPVDCLAIAWDESRAAARALADVLPLLKQGGQIVVLTVRDEKALKGSDIAETLVSALQRRGYTARAVDLSLRGRSIAEALQSAAIAEGARLLAMGGFGHSRLREFVLGGATLGVLSDLRLPVLMSH